MAINNLVKTNLTNHQAVKHQIIIKILTTYTKFKPQKRIPMMWIILTFNNNTVETIKNEKRYKDGDRKLRGDFRLWKTRKGIMG